MIDFSSLPNNIQMMCSFDEFPTTIQSALKFFIPIDEQPTMCVFVRILDDIYFYVVTPSCCIWATRPFRKGKVLEFLSMHKSDDCYLLSKIVGISRPYPSNQEFVILFDDIPISFKFADDRLLEGESVEKYKNIGEKFINMVISLSIKK